MTPGKGMRGNARVLIAGVAQLSRAYNVYSRTNQVPSKVLYTGGGGGGGGGKLRSRGVVRLLR